MFRNEHETRAAVQWRLYEQDPEAYIEENPWFALDGYDFIPPVFPRARVKRERPDAEFIAAAEPQVPETPAERPASRVERWLEPDDPNKRRRVSTYVLPTPETIDRFCCPMPWQRTTTEFPPFTLIPPTAEEIAEEDRTRSSAVSDAESLGGYIVDGIDGPWDDPPNP